MKALLFIALGGGAGSVARYLTTLAALKLLGPQLPWGTLAVNVAGSLAMGFLAGAFEGRAWLSQEMRLLLTTGFLGGFTTFSAFSLDAIRLLESQGALVAGGYVAASVALSVAALIAGLMLARFVFAAA